MSSQVLEWAPFRLKPGIDEAALLRSSEKLQNEFLANQEGYVRRELIRNPDGGYVDLVWWQSMAAAEAAMKTAAESPACGAYFSVMNVDQGEPVAGVLHFHSLQAY